VPLELGRRFVLIDPIDGTKEFVAGRADFTVNVALIEDGVPVLGVVHVPALGETFAGSPAGATKRSLGVAGESREIRAAPRPARPRALVSRSHLSAETEAFLGRHDLQSVEKVGSSLKFCRVAEGAADLYPCLRRTMEWDTAAGQAVLEAAGGVVETLDGSRLVYGKRRQADDADFANPHFIAAGRR
jgi:3'(2'), 5'-bisphosphate nucleotidase